MFVNFNVRTLAAACLAVLLAGCSNNPHPPAWNNEDTLFLVMGADPVSYDPAVSYNAGDAGVMDLIYPSYYRYAVLKEKPWALELNLGLSEPTREVVHGVLHTPAGDKPYTGEKWTMELRHDLRFQDDPCFPGERGRPITAKDMEYTFKRLANPKTQFPLFGNLADKLLGWNSYGKGFKTYGPANYDRPLEGFELYPKNPYRFSVTFDQPYPQFKFLLAMHFTTPEAREAVDQYGDSFALQHPVGCGTFKLQEFVSHQHIVLVPNPNNTWEHYPTTEAADQPNDLLADAGKKLPFLKRIVFQVIPEVVTQYNLFDQGYVDDWGIGQGNAQFMTNAVKPGAKLMARGDRMVTGAYPSVEYCGFNMADPTFGGYTEKKRKLRQAISLSIDPAAYIDLLYQGLAKPSEFLLPSGIEGFDPNYKNPYRQYDPSLKKAKQLLAEAGYPNGIDPKTGQRLILTLDNATLSPVDRTRARFLIKEISQIGIDVEVSDETYATFSDKVKSGKVEFFDWGWIADYPDPENFLMLLYGGDSPDPNNTEYNNAEYNHLFEQIRSMNDSPERVALIHKMRDIAVEDCPWVYLNENEVHDVFQPWVRNQICNPIVTDVSKYRDIDHSQRSQLESDWNKPVLVPFLVFLAVAVVGSVPAVRTVKRQRNRRVRRPIEGGGKS